MVVNLDKNKALGLDYSSPSFYVDSQGMEADYPKFYRNAQMILDREQRKLSLMKFGSNNYKKQKIKVAKLHEHLANQRQFSEVWKPSPQVTVRFPDSDFKVYRYNAVLDPLVTALLGAFDTRNEIS